MALEPAVTHGFGRPEPICLWPHGPRVPAGRPALLGLPSRWVSDVAGVLPSAGAARRVGPLGGSSGLPVECGPVSADDLDGELTTWMEMGDAEMAV